MGKNKKDLKEKRKKAGEKINDAKEVVQEQVADLLEENNDSGWFARHKGWVMVGAAFAAISTAVAYFFTRGRDVSLFAS